MEPGEGRPGARRGGPRGGQGSHPACTRERCHRVAPMANATNTGADRNAPDRIDDERRAKRVLATTVRL
jgi:hypothetical protein